MKLMLLLLLLPIASHRLRRTKFREELISGAGIGLRSVHHLEVLDTLPLVPWWEVHTENFFADGGKQLDFLAKLSALYPLSFHGVGLSLGSADGISIGHLQRIQCLVKQFKPSLLSEHLSWSAFNGEYVNDLCPIPYTRESLSVVIDNINRTQDFLSQQLLIENPSSYLKFKTSTMTEEEFILQVALKTGCGLLLDLNNVYVSSKNLDLDYKKYVDLITAEPQFIKEIHLAGHSVVQARGLTMRIDTHNTHVIDEVWELYEYVISKIGPRATLVEWDKDIPELNILQREAKLAQLILDKYTSVGNNYDKSSVVAAQVH